MQRLVNACISAVNHPVLILRALSDISPVSSHPERPLLKFPSFTVSLPISPFNFVNYGSISLLGPYRLKIITFLVHLAFYYREIGFIVSFDL